jgi:hypothetical protein
MPKITNDTFYPIVPSLASGDYLIILQDGIVKKTTVGALVGSPAEVTFSDSDTTINLSALGGILVIDNSSPVNVYLPSVGPEHIGQPLEVYRIGTGSVTVHAADADTINDSAAGGSVASTRAGQTDAAIVLRLITETRYAIASVIGSWTTT